MNYRRLLLFLVLLIPVLAVPVNGQVISEPDKRETQALKLFHEGDNEQAQKLLLEIVNEKGRHPYARYNLACVLTARCETDEAFTNLRQAFLDGFLDIHHLQRDPDLAPLRETPRYGAFLRELTSLRAEQTANRIKDTLAHLGTGYITENDDKHNLIFITSLDAASRAEMKSMIARLFDAAITQIFDQGLEFPVIVIIPRPDDYSRLVRQSNIGGFYLHDQGQLISRTIGANLRHELIHSLHWADMDRRNQVHPIWIQEGLASLFEDVKLEKNNFTAEPSWRTNIVKRLAGMNRLTHLETLVEMDRKRFATYRPSRNYAEARTLFMFIADRGELHDWYEKYTDTFSDDPTGLQAILTIMKQEDVRELEKQYADWIRKLPEVEEVVAPGGASLGVTVNDRNASDGVLIKEVHPGTGAARAGLRPGDVIVAVNGKTVQSTRDITRILGGLDVGRKIKLRLRREGEYFTRYVELTPR
ncbi:MAG TPA: PDZ domain-containing protein [Phycisphaeraceae bacterium]|nr:PDZ domain-containing protein [Phycisphaeraceae bacterium]